MNTIIENDFSNPETKQRYRKIARGELPEDQKAVELYEDGQQCGGCTFFAPLNADYGICCNKKCKFFKETVFEHFTCADTVQEGWGSHSFRANWEDLK